MVSIRWAIRVYGWLLVVLVPFFAPVEVEYKTSDLPETAIFVANHNSAVDPYLFGLISKDISFVTSWPFKIPLYNYFMRLADYVNAENGWESVRKHCLELLRSGCSLSIWPEGHRSRTGHLGRFKNGAFMLAAEAGVPIVPVCIINSGELLSPGKRMMTPARVRVIVLDPLFADENMDRLKAVNLLRTRSENMINKALREQDCLVSLRHDSPVVADNQQG